MTNAQVDIIPVENRKQQKQFLTLPWKLYKDDPYWIPPLRLNQKELVNYKRHPFYDTAEIQTFIATRSGEVVGRIAAIVDHAHNKYHNEQRGMFGFFESIDDSDVSNALFDAACNWHRAKGMTDARGPSNPSQNYEWGLLIEGFDSSPAFMMTYNPPYYADLIEGFGFEKAQDLFAYWGHASMLADMPEKVLFILKELRRRFDLKTRPLNRKKFKEDVRSFMDIYNRALPGQWGFVPLSEAELEHSAAGMKFLIVPQLSAFAEIDGKIIGAVFGLLDYNPIIKKIDGRLFPFGFLKLLSQRKNIKLMRLLSTNVVPEYQRWGIALALMEQLLPNGLEWGIDQCELSWVLESNKLSRGTIETGGGKRYKTYRIYDLTL